MPSYLHRCSPLAIFLVVHATLSGAELKVANLFSNGAVLQREQPIPVWGTADSGEEITVRFAGKTHVSTTTASGHWRVTLDSLPASSEFSKLIIKGKADRQLEVHDVLVGEVSAPSRLD